MKKISVISIIASTLIMASPYEASSTVEEIDNTFVLSLPTSFALLGGVMQGDGSDMWEQVLGVEFSFKCLMSDDIRSQLQFTQYDDDTITMLQLSMNPHYIFNRGEDMEFGIGPSFGIAQVELGDEKDTIYTYGLGASLRVDYDNNFFIGTEARYEWTKDIELGTKQGNLNNAKILAKVGFWF